MYSLPKARNSNKRVGIRGNIKRYKTESITLKTKPPTSSSPLANQPKSANAPFRNIIRRYQFRRSRKSDKC